MGSGSWSTDVYDAAKRYRRATGASAFAYSDSGARRVHDSLNPHGVAMRESRDSDEHPQSVAISVLFDVTGSMGGVPRMLQQKLPKLFGLLLRNGYAKDPQIMFGAIGDATCDRVPLQVSQFESDNRMDDHLGNIVLEGGGGGQMTESYELAMHFMARHTSIDCFEKRGRRGYLFIIGDEMAYPKVFGKHRRDILGESSNEDVPLKTVVREVTRMYDTYFLLPSGTAYAANDTVLGFWRDLLGQNALELDDLDAACETIGLTVGLGEGAIDLDEGLRDIADTGAAGTVSKALARVPARRGAATSALPPVARGTDRIQRL